MMKRQIFAVVLTAFCGFACSNAAKTNDTIKPSATRTPTAEPVAEASIASTTAPAVREARASKASDSIPASKAECETVDTGDNVVQKSQSFAIDFAPFKGACFVTSYNPEYDEPPMESEFAIFKDGKKTFDFPSRFNGVTFGCSVDAVTFQDLNGDLLTDIIVVGKCTAKTAPYNENMVYVNTGSGFITNEEANYKLTELKKAKDIADLVQKNKELFFQ
ncbi:MAG: hypothetical protein WBD22_02050 [Pyrinomonadaceae bacterium]